MGCEKRGTGDVFEVFVLSNRTEGVALDQDRKTGEGGNLRGKDWRLVESCQV